MIAGVSTACPRAVPPRLLCHASCCFLSLSYLSLESFIWTRFSFDIPRYFFLPIPPPPLLHLNMLSSIIRIPHVVPRQLWWDMRQQSTHRICIREWTWLPGNGGFLRWSDPWTRSRRAIGRFQSARTFSEQWAEALVEFQQNQEWCQEWFQEWTQERLWLACGYQAVAKLETVAPDHDSHRGYSHSPSHCTAVEPAPSRPRVTVGSTHDFPMVFRLNLRKI